MCCSCPTFAPSRTTRSMLQQTWRCSSAGTTACDRLQRCSSFGFRGPRARHDTPLGVSSSSHMPCHAARRRVWYRLATRRWLTGIIPRTRSGASTSTPPRGCTGTHTACVVPACRAVGIAPPRLPFCRCTALAIAAQNGSAPMRKRGRSSSASLWHPSRSRCVASLRRCGERGSNRRWPAGVRSSALLLAVLVEPVRVAM